MKKQNETSFLKVDIITDITKLKEANFLVIIESKEDLQVLNNFKLDITILQKLEKCIREEKDALESFFIGTKEIETLFVGVFFGKTKEKCITFLGPKISTLPDTLTLLSNNPENIKTLLDITYLSKWSFTLYKAEKKGVKISIVSQDKKLSVLLEQRIKTLENIVLARELGETPASDLSPEIFAKKIQKTDWKNTKVIVLSPKDIEKKGLGLLHGVGKGSHYKPHMVILERIVNKKYPTIGFVGKGVIFDTGGLNIKLQDHMFEMKQDMNGAGTVFAVMKELDGYKDLKVNVIACLPLADNAISGESFRPSDILTSYTGKTVQITNTDAEGRLILADAVGYISKNYSLTNIITIATLTGACVHALGHRYAGIMGNDDAMIGKLTTYSKTHIEKYNQLPFDEYFIEKTTSTIADLDNWTAGVMAGPTMGAAFIANFITKKELYTHIDIAGVSINSFEPYGYFPKGATGYGVDSLSTLFKNL